MQHSTRQWLIQAAPGQRLYVPSNGRPKTVKGTISDEHASDLKQYSGEFIDVPTNACVNRKTAVLERHKKGASVRQLINEFGLSRRQIQRITKGHNYEVL